MPRSKSHLKLKESYENREEESKLLRKKSKTFLDIPREVREKKLDNFRAMDLKAALPSTVWKDLMTVYFENGHESEEGRRVFGYLMEHSKVYPKIAKNFTNFEPFQYLYRFEQPNTPIDEYFVRSLSATAIHLRMVSLQDNLPGIIRRELVTQELRENEKFFIIDVGSGPGDAIRKALRKKHHRDLLEKIEVHCVDSDERPIRIGNKLVKRDGLSKNIKFFNKTMAEYCQEDSRKKNNLTLAIGLLCAVPNTNSVDILSTLYEYASPHGAVIYSTVQEEMLWGDPFLDVFMRIIGWNMHFKSEEEADFVGLKAKWKVKDTFYDLLNYNRMTICYK